MTKIEERLVSRLLRLPALQIFHQILQDVRRTVADRLLHALGRIPTIDSHIRVILGQPKHNHNHNCPENKIASNVISKQHLMAHQMTNLCVFSVFQ